MKLPLRLGWGAVALTMLSETAAAREATSVRRDDARPNVVFILADDLGWNDLSVQGSTFYESPNLDALAASGMKFDRSYAACRVCSPSRASIMTGKYPTNHGVTTWIGDRSGEDHRKHNRHDSHLPADYDRVLRADEITIAEVFNAAGYTTFFAGKWHLGTEGSWPTDHGFDINVGGWDSGGPKGGYFAPWTNPNLESGPDGESLTLRLGRETASFIESHRDEPFFAFLSFYAVHGPIQTTPELWSKYREKAAQAGIANERFEFDRRLGVRTIQDNPVYAGLVETMDAAVGIVLDRLDELGLREHTIVCFTSDNGGVSSGDDYATSNLPLRGGKGRQWEAGTRVPAFIRAPGVTTPGSVSGTPLHGIDWYPTLLDLAGLRTPSMHVIDGEVLTPVLLGKTMWDRPLYFHYPHYGNQGGEPSSVVLDGSWKLIRYHEDGREELYNITSDPGERVDIAAQEITRVEVMGGQLSAWLSATGAKMPLPDEAFDAAARDKRIEAARTAGIRKLERKHAAYLDEDFDPENNWWGSSPTRD